MDKLSEYKGKRNFKKTKEPKGATKKTTKKLHFCVQLHYAKRTHYDLRLESGGVLISFAIPKCPSYNPKVKRLAVNVEDHPYSYKDFEGIIPKGEYGGGTVVLFDEGYYENLSKKKITPKNKVIKIKLFGARFKGIWNLIYVKDNNWLLIKENDEYTNYVDLTKYNTSVKSGRTKETIDKIKKEKKQNNSIETINITNPNKVIYDKLKITKLDIAKYYQDVAPYMLPFIENRLLSTIRCPDGINGTSFFKKHFENINNFLFKKIIKSKDYYYLKDITGLISEVQMNSFEFHIWCTQANNINKPDILVFDLDPDKEVTLDELRTGVKDLKSILDKLNLKSYLKISGGKGYHIVVPLKSVSFVKHRAFAKDVAKAMENMWPNKYVANMRLKNRKHKIFIDWVRNTKSATSVAPYSLRIREKATISMPIKWNDLDKIKPDEINILNYKKYLKLNPWQKFYDLE